MPQDKAGIATTILAPPNKGEGFVEISPNKTLFIQKLTYDDPIAPEIIESKKDDDGKVITDVTTVDKVFEHFKPHVEVEMDKEDGSSVKEDFKFGRLGDFDAKALTNQSPYLKNLDSEFDNYLGIVQKLKKNKSLSNVIQNPESKQAFIDALKAIAAELESK